MASVLLPSGGSAGGVSPGPATPKKSSSVSGVLNEIARTAESVGAVKKSAVGGNGKVLGWVAGVTGALGMLGAAAYRFIGFMPELRRNKEQQTKDTIAMIQEHKKPFKLRSVAKNTFKPNAEMCDDSNECFKAEVSKVDEKGRFEARLDGGFILKDCSVAPDGSKFCVRNGRRFKVR